MPASRALGLNTFLAMLAGRASVLASASLRRGGTSLPGLVALHVEPHVVRQLASQLARGTMVIAGTNGKTTTAALTAAALRAGGQHVVHNRAGSNMMRGIATALLRQSTIMGRVLNASQLGGLFEVDEAALPAVLGEVQPKVVLLTNLFRDQLDRYAEIATTAERWREAIGHLPTGSVLVLNADDPLIASLAGSDEQPAMYYGVESWDGSLPRDHVDPALSADSLFCPRCAVSLRFTLLAYAHLGHYACPACGFGRPRPDVSAIVDSAGPESSTIRLRFAGAEASCHIALPGRYNAYNAVAAVAAAVARGVPLHVAAAAVAAAPGAFGRAETVQVAGRTVRLYLIKNPTGADEVFRVAAQGQRSGELLLLLSDNAADGEDVSWIWDAQLELLLPWHGYVVCGGTRAEDMALRLKYAGHGEPVTVLPRDVAQAVRHSLALGKDSGTGTDGGSLTILATYTAMLAARSTLARDGHLQQYWRTLQ